MTDPQANPKTATIALTKDQQQLAAENIRLVYLLVHRLQRRRSGLNFDDLVGAGMMGLSTSFTDVAELKQRCG